MLEVLVVVLIMSCLSLFGINRVAMYDGGHIELLNELLLNQTDSLVYRRDNYVEGLKYNAMGNVNMARTFNVGGHRVIVHLGNGYVSYE